MFAALAIPAVSQDAQPVGKGSIEGTVVNELMREPVRKAEVTLSGQSPTRALTDQTGRFIFRGLPPGTFSVIAQRAGFEALVLSQITLAADEKKTGIEIELVPLAAISGRIVDEFGGPIADCSVGAMKVQHQQGKTTLVYHSVGSTDDKGEYRIHDLPQGRYYVRARCSGELAVPHPFIRRDDPDKPHQVYVPLFYPGVAEPEAATRVAVAPGAEVRGIDIQEHRADAVTVRGRIASDAENVLVTLFPEGSGLIERVPISGTFDRATGMFRIPSVLPGSYLLVANVSGEGPVLQAQMPVEIGKTAPDPIDLTPTPGADVSGTLEIEGGDSSIPGEAQISLTPIDAHGSWYTPQSHIGKDGTFALHGVLPGRWTLNVMNVPGYVKVFTIEGNEFPRSFDITAGAAGPWRIVMSTKTGRLSGALTTPFSSGQTALVLVLSAGFENVITIQTDGRFDSPGVPLGRYRIFAVEGANAWELTHREDFLKAIENRSQVVEVTEGDPVKVTLDLIHADELKRILEELE
jgi:hypothetical protein